MIKKDLDKYLKDLDAILISSHSNISYLTNYFGFSDIERECFLLIAKGGDKYLITDKRYSEALEYLTDFKIIDIGALNFISKDYSSLLKNLRILRVGIEENDLTVVEYKTLRKKLKKTFNIDLTRLREQKNEREIKNIKNACKIGDLAFDFILGKLKKGVSEKELAFTLESYIKQKNVDISFNPIVAFGKNSSVPHHLSDKTKLKQNQIVLLDFGVKVNNYCSDMSRTVFFGKALAQFKRMHQTVLDAQTKAIQFLRSSIVNSQSLIARDIDKIARDYIIKQGFPNIPHSLGHGIGIEVHESLRLSPTSKDRIKPGMVFSVEPGIYVTGYGGVRIEDLVVITKRGAELISHSNRGIIEL